MHIQKCPGSKVSSGPKFRSRGCYLGVKVPNIYGKYHELCIYCEQKILEALGYIAKRNKKTSLDQLAEFGVEVNDNGGINAALEESYEMTEQDFLHWYLKPLRQGAYHPFTALSVRRNSRRG